MTQRGPYRKRMIKEPPRFQIFKPAGISTRSLKQIEMTLDEHEALRLADYRQFEHLEASQKMNISRPTFTRLINQARSKVAKALIEGTILVIGGGNIDFKQTLHYCQDCGEIIKQTVHADLDDCQECGSTNTEDLATRHLDGSEADGSGESEGK